MKHLLLFCWLAIFFLYTKAQDPTPVTFLYSQQRVSDSEILLSIKARVKKGELFSVRKISEDLPYSSIIFDSSAQKILRDSIMEKGHLVEAKDPVFNNAMVRYTADSVEWQQKIFFSGFANQKVKGVINYLLKQGDSFNSFAEKFSFSLSNTSAVANTARQTMPAKGKSLWNILLIAFLAGIGTVLTPCVFPLIPVTVGFFTKRSATRKDGIKNSIFYSLSIILIYTIPTFILTAVFGDSILYRISTSTVANLLFFSIFIVFAISFFGAFELNLPSSWANAIDSKAGKGGFLGIFFMALTLVIVSFSCTGPIVSSLITGTASQGIKLGTAGGMLAFSLGLALPFSLFAFFPSLLSSLPRSGGWLNSVKVVFGFLELALALKFLSNADLSNHWRLLDREVFIGLWIVIFVLLGFYLLGKLKFSHDSELPFITVPRLFMAIATFSFALYMVPGLWGAPLNFLSGLLPHPSTQDFNLNELKYEIEALKQNGGPAKNNSPANTALPPQKYTSLFHVPFGLTAYFDLNEALAASKASHKPIMIDFTGHSCANCRKMENEVWSKPEVLQLIRNDFVLLSLYVDDQTDLADEEVFQSKRDNSKITTIGGRNLDYEQTKFNEVAQPLYMFLDSEGNALSDIKYGYDSDVQKFVQHLGNMKNAFAK